MTLTPRALNPSSKDVRMFLRPRMSGCQVPAIIRARILECRARKNAIQPPAALRANILTGPLVLRPALAVEDMAVAAEPRAAPANIGTAVRVCPLQAAVAVEARVACHAVFIQMRL